MFLEAAVIVEEKHGRRLEPHRAGGDASKHATFSGDITREEGGFTEEQIAIAEQHHEMMDGSGCPKGLKGDVSIRTRA